MCDLCQVELDIVELALFAEGPQVGHRLPRPYERHVRFGAIDDAITRSAGIVARYLAAIGVHIASQVVAQAEETGDPYALLRLLTAWSSPTSTEQVPGLVDALTVASDGIAAELRHLAQIGANVMRTEAVDSGVHPIYIPLVDAAGDATVSRIVDAHSVKAAQDEAIRQLGIVTDAAAQAVKVQQATSATVAQAARTAVDGSSAAPRELAGRVASEAAQGAGRELAAVNIQQPASKVYASELRDRNTCGPCASVDGTEYDSVAAGQDDYPGFSGFVDCQGGDRCRGTLVLVWDETPAVQ